MEQKPQNKRRRRSSITQQLHRIFNFDRQEFQKQRESWHVPSNASASWQHRKEGTDTTSYHNDQYNNQSSHQPTKGSPDLGDLDFAQACGAASGEPQLRSGHQKSSTELEHAVEKAQGFSGTPVNAVRLIETSTAQNVTNSVSQKKEKRVTRRLEAERIELEKRLSKLEQTQLAGNHNSLKRETRRLTKKQPLGSSSRGSSVSADESRPSSRRLSALFSISRRTSMSRSSSVNGRNGEESTDSAPIPTETPADDVSTLRVAKPSLSTSLPERFSAIISKGLIVENNALLQDQTPPAQSSPSPPATTTATNQPETLEVNEECSLQKPEPTLEYVKHQIDDYGESSKSHSLHTSPDLDRISFAATLHLARRARDNDQLQGRSPGTVQRPSLVQRDVTQNGKLYDSQTPGSSKMGAVSQPNPSAVENPSSLPTKESVKSIPRRTFKPSPLAGDSTSRGSSQSLAGNSSASRLRNSGGSSGAKRTPSSPLVTVATSMSPAVGSLQFLQPLINSQSETEREGKALDAASERTPKLNNSANTRVSKEQEALDYVSSQHLRSRHSTHSSAPLSYAQQLSVKSRIQASTNDRNINHSSLKHKRQEEATAIHGSRTARFNQDIPPLPEHKSAGRLDAQQFATPGSTSSRSSSPEPCSEDYNTADETGSIGSVTRGNNDCLDGKSAAASGPCFVQNMVESNDSTTRASRFSDVAVSKELESMYDYLAKVILLGPSGAGKSYYRGAAGAILIYDISSQASFAALPTFLMDARALASPNLTVLLAGNKADLASDSVTPGDFADDSMRAPPTPSSTSSKQSSFPIDSVPGSVRSTSHLNTGTRLTATYAFEGRQVSAEESAHWAAKANIPVAVEVSALTGEGVEELFNRLARIILTKIELGEIDPDDPQSGIQYGDGGLYGQGTSDGSSIRSRMTVDENSVQMHRRNPKRRGGSRGVNNWRSNMGEWEEVFRLSGSHQKKGTGCC
ncbi:hypothetical protein CNMCM5623_001150 [Aspergillus felis]|uniref:Uncharacterized protein n=1 Tax=Aspergillus felis TaxID=1287682 RepID=A0A8H6Q7L8_9EURO|nr:hypothetical protein CNMCM5623_001150 [Aspergillus felis]KAF7177124.1 hypothetical protein CNMCM7691_004858 [Aspergillus felis]